MPQNLAIQLKNLPHKPGVYIFKSASGEVLYIGKARDLKNRVSQYFQKDFDGRHQIPFLMNEAKTLEHIITDNEIESLFLENTLIKKYKPKYNIKLRDDKNYVFIKIDFDTEIPQIYTVRNPDSSNAKYFGPYSSAQKVRETLQIARKIFPYCANKKVGLRPCFYYYLHKCPGVCIGKISLEEYAQTIKRIILFLSGNIGPIKKELYVQMRQSAKNKRFEKAAHLRDQIKSLEVIEEKQKAIFAKKVDWDFISYFQTADKSCVNVFAIRKGKLIDRKNFILEETQNKAPREIISAFIENYYLEDSEDLPKEIYVQENLAGKDRLEENTEQENAEALKTLFSQRKIKIIKPAKGKKFQLIRLGQKNAQEYFENWAMQQASEISRTTLALDELGNILKLQKTPVRIECFDISNIQGTNAVASMVVFENGKPKKSDYRKFKMKVDGTPNDFAMMREALNRRFNNNWPLPDLLVIDGGKGQLGIAKRVLEERSLQIPAIGLAKREEEIFKPGQNKPVILPKSNYSLQLLQRLRDEAHRFAITFHKKIRSKQAYKSILDSVPGIGPKKKKILLQRYGSVKNIKEAEQQELASLIGKETAQALKETL